MVVIVFFRCSFFEHFQFGISIRVLSGLCSLSIFFLLFFSIRHRVLTPTLTDPPGFRYHRGFPWEVRRRAGLEQLRASWLLRCGAEVVHGIHAGSAGRR